LQGEVDRTTSLTGEKRRLFVTYSPAPPDLVLVHAEDITARVQLEQQLRQGQKMEAIGRLAGGVAHDFNNLLAVILSYADLASDGLAPGEQRHEDLQQIQKAARRATELTRQLLAFSRQQVLQPRIVELNGILVAMQQMLAPLLGADIELVTAFEDDTGRVLADPGQLEQVVMNLAVNARDAMPEGGTLSLEARNTEIVPPGGDSLCRYVLLEVRDTGTGMDAATCARIFEPFFTSKAVGKGTGLGLATVFGIVEQSGGFIVVDSELGRGSSFKIYLPRTDRPEKISDSPVRAAKNAGSETILLVEDEEQVRTVAGLILRRNGYRVLEANDGFEALAVAGGHDAPIDLLLTDMSMPKMGGAKLAEALGKEHPRMKILFVSGYTDDALVRHGITSAGFAFLQKPFTLDTLLVKVREVLDENP
ncbi:MAG: response regulator, partial [Proteobacteria bacterium]